MIRRILLALLVVSGLAVPSTAATRCAPDATPAGGCTATYASPQAAINAAVQGDTVSLHPETYTGSLSIPNKGALTQNITITTDADPANLPAPGMRICGGNKCGHDLRSTIGIDLTGIPDYTPYLPKIVSSGGGAAIVTFEAGANHYVLRGLWFPAINNGYNTQMEIGAADSAQQFESQEPYAIIIDQCYFAGDPFYGQVRSIAPNGKSISITNNFIDDSGIAVGQDGQCIAGWNGHGPLTITNNFLNCGTENIILGGSDPHVRTRFAITGSPTTTSATVTTIEASHTLPELAVGQRIAICTSSASATACCPSTGSLSNCEQGISNFKQVEFATIVSIGTGSTGTIIWTPATSVTPDTTGLIRGGAVLDGLTFRRNYVTKDPAWINSMIATPTMSSATAASGGTLTGTYYYKAQAWNSSGSQENVVRGPVASTEVNATASSQKITVSYSAIANNGGTGFVRVFRGTSANAESQYTDCSTTACLAGTFVDTGSLSWTTGTPGGYDTWVIKNLFELKACTHCQVDSNIFHNQWGSYLFGMGSFKSTNQEGGCWFCGSSDFTIELNWWRHGNGCFTFNGRESEHGPRPPSLTRPTLRNNLCSDSTPFWALGGDQMYGITIADGINTLSLLHNTFIHTMNGMMQIDGLTSPSPVFRDNMMRGATYGIKTADGDGQAGLDFYMPGWAMDHNGVGNISASGYPTGNTYETLSAWQAEFTNYSDNGTLADYVLAPGSALRSAGSDGKDVGVDIAALQAALVGVDTGAAENTSVNPKKRQRIRIR